MLTDLPGPYHVILADPPVRYDTNHGPHTPRTAERHYPTMTFEQLARVPVPALALPDAVLYLWMPPPHLPAGLDLMGAWGFTYKTVGFAWEKPAVSTGEPRLGAGWHTRANVEVCLLGTRGRGVKRVDSGVSMVIRAPRREHSRKPDEVYFLLRRLYGGHRTYLELWSRSPGPGFDTWGNETGKFGVQLPLFSAGDEQGGRWDGGDGAAGGGAGGAGE